jgi:hypothetical protein
MIAYASYPATQIMIIWATGGQAKPFAFGFSPGVSSIEAGDIFYMTFFGLLLSISSDRIIPSPLFQRAN